MFLVDSFLAYLTLKDNTLMANTSFAIKIKSGTARMSRILLSLHGKYYKFAFVLAKTT